MLAVSPTYVLAPHPLRMDPTRAPPDSSHSSSRSIDASFSASNPFVLVHGRRYLRDLPYPLPCDLPELQRQNLYTYLATATFGTPLCCPSLKQRPPRKVLELCCGAAYWSSICHDLFTSLGRPDVEFVGLDIVSVAPNMRKHGMNWRFVQHDIREVPLPFPDDEFDLVLMKDLSIVVPTGLPSDRLLDEAMRILRPGGVLEWWECDYSIRSLLPHPRPPVTSRTKRPQDMEQAVVTGTFVITPATPFAARVTNKYLQDYNGWIQTILDKRQLAPTPCSRMAPTLLQEPESLTDVDWRRVAIPLGTANPPPSADGIDDGSIAVLEMSAQGPRALDAAPLSEDQLALRQTALQIIVQLIESLEPLLKEASGKSGEEWFRWWTWMMADLLDNFGASNGECLEIGSWWAKKV